jgi:hypothetical protein
MREQVIRICVDPDRVAEAGFACRSQGAGGFGNPLRVPILIVAVHVTSYPSESHA